MRNIRLKKYVYCIITGFIISALNIILSLIIYADISTEIFSLILALIFILGNMALLFSLSLKKTTIKENIFRFVLTIFSSLCIVVINGYLGTNLYFYELLNIDASDSADNVSGLLSLSFFLILIIVGVIYLTITSFFKIKLKNKKLQKSGDNSKPL